jgi:pyrroline-5-carboxylate reductase
MGIAIMGGVMSSLAKAKTASTLDPSSAPKDTPNLQNFVACDTWAPAEANVKKALGHYNFNLTTHTNNNLAGVSAGDIILLSCKPYGYKDILGEEGMRDALKGKVLVSILAGVTQAQIEEFLYPEGASSVADACRVVRAQHRVIRWRVDERDSNIHTAAQRQAKPTG